ncbi:MAG: hypothetical protein ACFE89_09570 [Candidatus Hodarchaeota archaeon]
MKRELKRAIVGNIIGGVALVIFFLVLEFLTPISVALLLARAVPSMAAGIIGGLIGTYIALRRKPDERMQLILKQSARNAFWMVVMTLPFMSIAFMFLPTQTGVFYGIWLFGLWIFGMVIFYISMIIYYYS